MKFELDEYNRNISENQLIEDLVTVAKKLEKSSISCNEYDLNGKYSSKTYFKRFGTWSKALEKAGLQKTRTSAKVPEEDLFKNLEEIWIKLGRQPKWGDIQKPLSRYLVRTYVNRFGTWRKALEKFVLYINKEEDSSTKDSTRHLKVEKNGRHTTKRELNWRLRFIVMKRDNFKCKSCGRSPATDSSIILHVDHIKAWANGGETVLENLQTLCSKCNIGKSNLGD